MERQTLVVFLASVMLIGCEQTQQKKPVKEVREPKISKAELKRELTDQGFQIFDYVDENTKDTVLMQQYFVAFLKSGPNRSQSKEAVRAGRLVIEVHPWWAAKGFGLR